MLQRAVSSAIRDYARDYWTGTVYTTNRRIWEHDEEFKEYLKKTRAMLSIWKQQPYSAAVLPIIFPREPFCWFQTNR